MPGVPVADTIKVIDPDGRVVATPDRATLRAVQTPQAFRADALRRAHEDAGEATDDAALIEALGGSVVVVEGEPTTARSRRPTAWSGCAAGSIARCRRDRADPSGDGVRRAPLQRRSRAAAFPRGRPVRRRARPGRSQRRRRARDGPAPTRSRSCGPSPASSPVPATRSATSTSRSCASGPSWRRGAPRWNVVSATPPAPVSVSGRRAESLGAIGRSEGIAAWAVAVVEAKET